MATPTMAKRLITGANMMTWNLQCHKTRRIAWNCGKHNPEQADPTPPSLAAEAGTELSTLGRSCRGPTESFENRYVADQRGRNHDLQWLCTQRQTTLGSDGFIKPPRLRGQLALSGDRADKRHNLPIFATQSKASSLTGSFAHQQLSRPTQHHTPKMGT